MFPRREILGGQGIDLLLFTFRGIIFLGKCLCLLCKNFRYMFCKLLIINLILPRNEHDRGYSLKEVSNGIENSANPKLNFCFRSTEKSLSFEVYGSSNFCYPPCKFKRKKIFKFFSHLSLFSLSSANWPNWLASEAYENMF